MLEEFLFLKINYTSSSKSISCFLLRTDNYYHYILCFCIMWVLIAMGYMQHEGMINVQNLHVKYMPPGYVCLSLLLCTERTPWNNSAVQLTVNDVSPCMISICVKLPCLELPWFYNSARICLLYTRQMCI